MNKTLHNKLTEKTSLKNPSLLIGPGMGSTAKMLLLDAAKELLQPRSQAVANILKMAKGL